MRVVLEGAIAGAAFESRDAFVVGMWESGPLGPMTDVMWARPDGTRVLLAPHEDAAAFVAGVYAFDEVRVVPCRSQRSDGTFSVIAGDLTIEGRLAPPSRLFSLRPRRLRRSLAWVRVEDVLARGPVGRLVIGGARGVRLYGTTPGGAREWYRIDGYRPVAAARAALAGDDLGTLTDLPELGFGFSGFPAKPALVACSPVLEGIDARALGN